MSNPIQQAIDGLERIVRWDELSSEFKMNYGSNGERDHFRGVASDALSALQSLQGVELPKPVAAQHRFRHPQKGTPDWSIWQPCSVMKRRAWEIDSQGYEVEYRSLYTADQLRTSVAAAMARGAVPQGWKLVPVEPTWDMKMAASSNYREPRDGHYTARMECAADAYRAMLSAAPTPEATQPTQAEAPSEREAFEAWARGYGYQRDELDRCRTGIVGPEYYNANTETTWKAWQARAALATQQAGQGWPLDCNPKCAVSWSGFNVYGDEKSIKEVNRLMHMDGRAADLQRILESERALRTTPPAPQQPEALAQQERVHSDNRAVRVTRDVSIPPAHRTDGGAK